MRRQPRAPGRLRPSDFHDRYEARALFYDCFRHADGQRILLVGPPPMNLMPKFATAKFSTETGVPLTAGFHRSLSTMITELSGAGAAATSTVAVALGGHEFTLPVEPNSSAALSGKRILFSMNRDNDLAWIREWATFHARLHGTDAVVLFDNGSTRYGVDELIDTLSSVEGLTHIAVPSWPYSFGPIDPAVKIDPYWSRFLQIASMSVVLRRYGADAFGLLDCDIDELAGTHSGRSIYDLAQASRGGLVVFQGRWIEAVPPGAVSHGDYRMRLADSEAALSGQKKWALDARRRWVRNLDVHPYWHFIARRPLLAKSTPTDALYWHFKGINTGWKDERNAAPGSGVIVEDAELAAAFRRLAP